MSDYIVVVSWDAERGELTYQEKNSGSDAHELNVTHGRTIEWQPARQGAHEVEIDFESGGNDGSPFDGDQPQTGKSSDSVRRTLRTLSGDGPKSYKYSVSLKHEAGTESEDPVVIIGD